MILVRNHHAAHVEGLAPGAIGEVNPETLQRRRWAFDVLEALPEKTAVERPSAGFTAREAREAIRQSEDPTFIRQFIGDARSSIHQKAVARLKRIG